MAKTREGMGRAFPAPVGGWNARDDWDTMKENQAISLINWFPGTDSVETRRGKREFATGLDGQVQTVAEFRSENIRQLLAAAGGNFYNVSTGGAVTLKSGFINNIWQHVNFGGQIGFVNGADTPQKWDGVAMTDNVITGPGLDPTTLISNTVYSSRVWYIPINSQDVWYSNIDTLGGALTKFPLSRVGQLGGNLVAVGTWTRDSGDGADDWIVFVMSSGEVVVYAGDPATDFIKIGTFDTGEPLSRRCLLNYGANLWILTREGLLDLQSIMALGEANYDKAITDIIKGAYAKKTDQFGPRFGWDIIFYPKKTMVLLNVPKAIDTYEQYVVNTTTGAWCSFDGFDAFSWSLFNESLYYGGDGVVFQVDYGFSDAGEDIDADAETAFTYLKDYQNKKQVTMVMPVLRMNGNLTRNLTIGTDMQRAKEPTNCALKGLVGTPWGSPWGSPWNGGKKRYQRYTALSAWGYNHSLRLKICQQKQIVRWYSNRWVSKRGGVV